MSSFRGPLYFRIRVDWDENEGIFKGYLTQQGVASQSVGFTVGENIYSATLTTTSGVVNEWAKYRYGRNGVSTGFEWRTNKVDINLWPSSDDSLFYTGIAMKRIGSTGSSCQPSGQQPLPSYPYCLLIGEWESQLSNNKYRIRVQWDASQNLFRGNLSQQGEGSQFVGFAIGEFTWSAKIVGEILKEQHKWRYGSNGVSSSYEWRSGQPTINTAPPSNGNSFFSPAAGTTMVRVNGSAVSACYPTSISTPLPGSTFTPTPLPPTATPIPPSPTASTSAQATPTSASTNTSYLYISLVANALPGEHLNPCFINDCLEPNNSPQDPDTTTALNFSYAKEIKAGQSVYATVDGNSDPRDYYFIDLSPSKNYVAKLIYSGSNKLVLHAYDSEKHQIDPKIPDDAAPPKQIEFKATKDKRHYILVTAFATRGTQGYELIVEEK